MRKIKYNKNAFTSKADHPRMNAFLVMCSHFRSRDNGYGHTVWSAVAKNPRGTQTVWLYALSDWELLLPIKVLHCGNTRCQLFSSCDLDLAPMTFIYETHTYPLEIFQMCENELPRKVFRKLSYYSLQMRAFSYAWSIPVTWQRWWSHQSIRHSRKPHATCKPHVSIFYRIRVIGDVGFILWD